MRVLLCVLPRVCLMSAAAHIHIRWRKGIDERGSRTSYTIWLRRILAVRPARAGAGAPESSLPPCREPLASAIVQRQVALSGAASRGAGQRRSGYPGAATQQAVHSTSRRAAGGEPLQKRARISRLDVISHSSSFYPTIRVRARGGACDARHDVQHARDEPVSPPPHRGGFLSLFSRPRYQS